MQWLHVGVLTRDKPSTNDNNGMTLSNDNAMTTIDFDCCRFPMMGEIGENNETV